MSSFSRSSGVSFNPSGPGGVSSSEPVIDENNVESGRPFVEMIGNHATYRPFVNVETEYEVRLVHGLPYLHWYVLVRMKTSTSPYLTLEITTLDMTDIIPTTRNVYLNGGFWARLLFSPTEVGTYKGSLYRICQLADDAIANMDGYHFVENNCQHFCNRLLKKMGFKTFATTVGPELGGADHGFDILTVLTRNIYDATIGEEPTVAETAMISGAVGAPSTMKGDLQIAYGILLPVADKWEEIGIKIMVDHDTLSKIRSNYRKPRRCLSEMLRLWLQNHAKTPWRMLGDVVRPYDLEVSSKLCSRAITN